MADWYPWYPVRYKKRTMHLTAEQDGIYRRLIDHYMETGVPLSDDDNALARIVGISIECWLQNSDKIRPFFTSKNNELSHQTCNEELATQISLRKKNAENGRKGGRPKNIDKQEEKSGRLTTDNPNVTTVQDSTVQDNKERDNTASGGGELFDDLPPPGKKYHWMGKFISLNEGHYKMFKNLAPRIKLDEFLEREDEYLYGLGKDEKNKENWWYYLKGKLERENEKRKNMAELGL